MEFPRSFRDSASRFQTFNNITNSKRNDSLSYPIMVQCVYDGSDEIEVPVCCGYSLITNLSGHEPTGIRNRYVFPFFKSYHYVSYASAESVFNNLLRSGWRTVKGIIGDSEIFYGNAGILLNANYKTLFFVTHVFKFRQQSGRWERIGTNVYINPSVFIVDNKLNNLIKKKLLPWFIQEGANAFFSDSSKFVVNSCEDRESDTTRDESINNFLRENIREVLGQIVYDSE